MSLDIKTVENLNNGYSKVELSSKKDNPIYYTVPTKNAADFSDELKVHIKNRNINTALAMGLSAFIGVLGASVITKNKKKIVDIISKIVAGTTLAGISTYFVNDYNNKNYEKIMNKYQAKSD